MKEQIIEYTEGSTQCLGLCVMPDKLQPKMPAILIAPAFEGRSDLYIEKARKLAAQGYISFVVDMYGAAKVGQSLAENLALLKPFTEDRTLLERRILAAFDTFLKLPHLDTTKIAAIGFCFGAMCILDLARTGASLQAIVGFHGAFSAPSHAPLIPIKPKILMLHGYDDPLSPPSQLSEFSAEMKARKANWQCHLYSNVMHAFTDPKATEIEIGRKFDAITTEHSWNLMLEFIKSLGVA